MVLLLVFAFLSGLITIAAPCIWPLLPIVLSASSTGGKRKPLGVTLGLLLTFTVATLGLSYLLEILPIDANWLRWFAVVVIVAFGITYLVPTWNAKLETFISRFSGKIQFGFGSGFLTGMALGVVWAPCAGPILATIATAAATQTVSWDTVLVTLVYVTGIAIPLFLFTLFGNRLLSRSRWLNQYLGRIQQGFGVVMILAAIAIATNYDKVIEVKLLDLFPNYTSFITDLESTVIAPTTVNGYPAPELEGITGWLNSEPLTLEELRGKVVLIDFWTYTCINCIRTLPHVQAWYEQYEADGLVVIGVHSPEFEFEKDTNNVRNAIAQYGLTYPVAQDNDFATWFAYNNRYWPAEYLIDADGKIRYTHFGEGEYEKTETAIRQLLAEAGTTVTEEMVDLPDETPQYSTTPETYLGLGRIARFASLETIQYGVGDYTFPETLPLHRVAFNGSWDVESQYSEANVGSQLRLHFKAADVFLVIKPAGEGDTITVNDQTIVLDTERLYQVYQSDVVVDDELTITFNDPSTQVFAFTFGD